MTKYSHSGSAINVELDITYDYIGHKKNEGELENLLNFDFLTKNDIREYTKKDIDSTLKFAVELAKEFLDSTHPVNPYSHYQTTKNLRDSVKYDKQASDGGYGGRLYADAADNRGHKYAGHIEYGFTDRAGLPHGPWPFLRPAMRIALSATRYDFAQSVAEGLLYGGSTGIRSVEKLNIGSKNAREQVMSVFGSTNNAVRSFRSAYQTKGREGRWDLAKNGIGYKSGVKWGNTLDRSEYLWGEF